MWAGQAARLARYRENAAILYDGVLALGLKPDLAREHQGPVIVTIHQPADPRFDLMTFVEALKRRGVLISNFYNTVAPTMRIDSASRPDRRLNGISRRTSTVTSST